MADVKQTVVDVLINLSAQATNLSSTSSAFAAVASSIQKVLDGLRKSVEAGIGGDKLIEQANLAAKSISNLAGQVGKSTPEIKDYFVQLQNGISNWTQQYAKSLSDASQTTILNVEVIDKALLEVGSTLATASRGKSVPVFDSLVTALRNVKDSIINGLDPAIIDTQIGAVLEAAKAAVSRRKQPFKDAINDAIVVPFTELRAENAQRQLTSIVTDIFKGASQYAKITIQPLELKDLQQDRLGVIEESFAAIGRVVKLLTYDTTQWETSLKQAFGSDTAALDSLLKGLNHLAPIFERLTTDSSSFGKLFNSGTRESVNNLYTLQKVLEIVDKYLIDGTNSLTGQITAVNRLGQELQVLRSAETSLKEIDTALVSETTKVNRLAVAVQGLNNVFATAGKQPETFGGFSKTETTAKLLEQSLEQLTLKLKGLYDLSKREDGSQVFGSQLSLELSAAQSRVLQLSRQFQNLNSEIAKIRTDHIDASLVQTAKATETFEKLAVDGLVRVRSGILSLGESKLTNPIATSLSHLLNGLKDPIKLVNDLTKIYTKFVTTVKGNIATVSINGVKESFSDFSSLIKIVQDYVNTIYSVEKANLDAASATGKVSKSQTQAVQSWQETVTKLNDLTDTIIRNGKEVSNQSVIYKTWVTSVQTGFQEALAAQDRFIKSTSSVNTSVATIVKEFDIFDEVLNRNSKIIDSAIKKFSDLARTGAELPKQLKGISVSDIKVNSLQDLIDGLNRLKQSVSDSKNNLIGFASSAKLVDTEYRRLAESIGSAQIPTSGIEAAKQYEAEIIKISGAFKQAATAATDFSSLQNVYSDYKKNLQSVYDAIQSVIEAERRMSSSPVNLSALEAVRKQVTEQTAAINVGLQKGGASLDILLQQTGRLQELKNQFTQLNAAVQSSEQSLSRLGQSGVSSDTLKEIKTETSRLIAERQSLIAEVANARNRLDSAMQTAIRTVGTGGDLTQLQQAAKAADEAFNLLGQDVKNIPATVETLGTKVKELETAVAPVIRLNEAIQQAEKSLQGTASATSNFGTSFDFAIRTLVDDLIKAGTQIGLMRTNFETKPREVLQSFMDDLRIKADELSKSYIEITKSIHLAESAAQAGFSINTASLEAARNRAESLRIELERTREASATLRETINRSSPSSTVLKGYGDIASSMHEADDKAAFLSKGLRSLFTLMLNQNASKLAGSLGEVQNKTDLVAAAVRKLENDLVGSMRNMEMMTMGLQMLGQAMIEPFQKGLEAFSKLEDTLTFIRGATGETEASIENLGKTTETIGSTTRYGAEQAADGFKQLALAGYDVEQQITALPTVLQLATAAETNLGSATNTVVQLMSSQRLAVEDVGKASDILSMAAIRTTATLEDMGTSFKYVGSIAGTMQNDITDTAAAVALLHNAGLRGSLAGTALRGSFQALLNPTKEESRVMEELSRRIGGAGLQITDSKGKFVGFVSLLQQFEEAGVQTNEVLELFGQRAGPGMAALLQIGSDKLKELESDLSGAEGSTARLAAMMEKTFAGRMQILSNSLGVLGESIGHSLSMALKPVVEIATAFVSKILVIREALGPLTPIIDNLVAGFAVLVLGIGTVALAWSMMLVPAAKFGAILQTLWVVLTKTASALLVVRDAQIAAALSGQALAISQAETWAAAVKAGSGLAGFVAVLRALSLALVTTPIGLLITALTTLAGVTFYLVQNMTTVNAELDRQAAIAVNSTKEFENLGKKIATVGVSLQAINNQNVKLDTSKLLNLSSVQEQTTKFKKLLDEVVTRYNESSDQVKKGLSLEKTFDTLTGQVTGLKVITAETGQVLTTFSTAMLSSKTVANDLAQSVSVLNNAVATYANKDAALAAEEKFINKLREHLRVVQDTSYTSRASSQKELSDTQAYYAQLLQLKQTYVAAEAALDVAKNSNDEDAIQRARENLQKVESSIFNVVPTKFDFSTLIETLDSELQNSFAKTESIKQKAAIFSKTVSSIITDAIASIKVTHGVVNTDSVMKQIEKDLDQANIPYWLRGWMPSFMQGIFTLNSADKSALLAKVRESLQSTMEQVKTEANKVSAEVTLSNQFSAMQRLVAQMIKTSDTQVSELTTRMEDLKKVMQIYKDNADAFIKYRDLIANASKAKMDVGISAIQQQTEFALTQIKATYSTTAALGDSTFSTLSGAAIGWGKDVKAVNKDVFTTFASYQGEQKKIANDTASQMYSYYHNSLERQIDDLTRATSSVTENVYTIPVRLEAEYSGFNTSINGAVKYGSDAIRYFVADAKKETGVFLQYSITFDQKLFDSKVRLENEKTKIITSGLNKEKTEIAAHYNSILPLYKIGSADRIKVEQEFATKRRDLDLKGIQSVQSALDRVKELYKSNADKIKKIEEDKQSFISRANAKRDELENSGLNDAQKLAKQKLQIQQLTDQASLESTAGNLDKAKALYEQAMSKIEGLSLEPWDQQSKQFVTNSLNTVEKGMGSVSDRLKLAGDAQQTTLEKTAKGLEDMLAGFSNDLSNVEKDLKDLATSLIQLQKDNAKSIDLKFDDGNAIAKLSAIAEKKLELDRMFEKPLSIGLNTDQALADMEKIQNQQIGLEKARDQSSRNKQDAESAQKQLDSVNQLKAAYTELSKLTNSISTNQLPEGVTVGTTLKDVTKDGSDGQKQLEAITQALSGYEKGISELMDTYSKADLSIPKQFYDELDKVRKARDSLSIDSKGGVLIDKSVGDVLEVDIDRLTKMREILSNLDTTKIDGMVNSFNTVGVKLTEIAAKADPLRDLRIGVSGTKGQAPTQALVETRKVLEEVAPALKELTGSSDKVTDALKRTGDTAQTTASDIKDVKSVAEQPIKTIEVSLQTNADTIVKEVQQAGPAIQSAMQNTIEPVTIPTTVQQPDFGTTVQQIAESSKELPTVEVKTDVAPLNLQTDVDALQNVQKELTNLSALQDKANAAKIDLFTPDQLQRMDTARNYIDGLLASTNNNQLTLTVNQESISNVISTLNDVRQQSGKVFDNFGKGLGGSQIQAQLDQLVKTRDDLSNKGPLTDIVDIGNFNKTTNGIMALTEAFKQYDATKKSAADVPVISVGAEQTLTTVSDKLTEFQNHLADVRKQEFGFYINPDVETKLKDLQDQVTQFQTDATAGVHIDSSVLDQFKQKITDFANSLDGTPVQFDFSSLNTAYSKVEELKSLLSTTPTTVPVKTEDSAVTQTIDYLKQLVGYDKKTINIDVITNLVNHNQSTTRLGGYNKGGLVEVLQAFARGGLAQIRRFATGGSTILSKLRGSIVPGSGNEDTVPAMLTPGEYVVRKSMVERYGLQFLNSLNSGLLQFRAFGGAIEGFPNLALAGMNQYLTPNLNTGSVDSSGLVDVRLHIGNKVVNMKSPRDEIKTLVAAAKQLER